MHISHVLRFNPNRSINTRQRFWHLASFHFDTAARCRDAWNLNVFENAAFFFFLIPQIYTIHMGHISVLHCRTFSLSLNPRTHLTPLAIITWPWLLLWIWATRDLSQSCALDWPLSTTTFSWTANSRCSSTSELVLSLMTSTFAVSTWLQTTVSGPQLSTKTQ